jgi:DNA-directed RNA polymerase subunit K/omega
MVVRPVQMNAYEFVVVAALRAHQLTTGSVARLPGQHSVSTMAQMEVADGQVARADASSDQPPAQCLWQL